MGGRLGGTKSIMQKRNVFKRGTFGGTKQLLFYLDSDMKTIQKYIKNEVYLVIKVGKLYIVQYYFAIYNLLQLPVLFAFMYLYYLNYSIHSNTKLYKGHCTNPRNRDVFRIMVRVIAHQFDIPIPIAMIYILHAYIFISFYIIGNDIHFAKNYIVKI